MDDITLSRRDVTRLTGNKRQLVSTDREVAMAKLVFERLFDAMDNLEAHRETFERQHSWLIGDGEPPPCVEGDDGGAGLTLAAYRLLCDRIDKRAALIMNSPKSIQDALVKHEDYKAKAGQMIPVATAFAVLLKMGGLAQRLIPDNRKAEFLDEFAKIQADFIEANPMLRVVGNDV